MAKVTASASSQSSSVSTFSPDLSAHSSGRLLAIWVVVSHNGGTISLDATDTSNFTDPSASFDTKSSDTGSLIASAFFICEAASAAETAPVFSSSGGSGNWSAICYTIKDYKTSDVIESADSGRYSSAKSGVFPQITPTNSDCLVLYFRCADTNTRASSFEIGVDVEGCVSGALDAVGGFIQHPKSSTLTPAIKWYSTADAQDGHYAVIAINDSGTTGNGGVDVGGITSVRVLPDFTLLPNTSHYNVTTASSNLTTLFDGSWPFSTPVFVGSQGGSTYGILPIGKSGGYNYAFIASSGASHNGNHVIAAAEITTSIDFTNKLFLGTVGYSEGGTSVGTESQGGSYVVFSDGTEIAAFRITALDSSPTATTAPLGIVIDPVNTTPDYESANAGPINWTAINRVGVMTYVRSVNVSMGLSGSTTFDISSNKCLPLVGGSTTNPIKLSDIVGPLQSNGFRLAGNQLGYTQGQYFTPLPLQIGDGSTKTVTDLSSQSLAFPGAVADGYLAYFIPTGALQFRLKFSSTDVFTSGTAVIDMGDKHKFIIDNSASNPSSASFDGLTVLSGDVTLEDLGANAYTGMTISGCNEVNYTTLSTASALGGMTIANCAETYAITVTSKAQFEALQNVDFAGNNVSIKITGNQTGTWSAAGMTVSGGTGSYDIEYTGTTDFTIEFDIGSGFSQVRVDNSAAVIAGNTGLTVSTPTVSLTVTSNIAASDIKIFETGTQTIEASATGTSASTSVAGTYDWTVQKAGYLPQRGTGVVLGTSSVPVSVTLIKDPVYSASHGLAYTTDFTYNRTTKKLTCVTRQAGRDFYSAMIDAFIAQSSLDNTPFPLTAVGIDSIFFNDDAELLDATSEDNWFDAGIRYINSSGTTTAEWCSIKSSGSIPAGVTGRYQTGAGTGTTELRTTGAVNQIIQIYGDATHGNFDHRSYLVIKFQANPYVDTRSDILSLAGVATLEPFEYSVAIEPTALDITAGDSGAVLTLVDHTAAPITVGGKSFSYEIQDGGTNSAEAILRAWDYNIAQTGTYQGTDTFNLPEFVAQSGSTYETRRGIVETEGSTPYGCYISRGGADHPDFTRFQSDDGTYYTPAVTANITITNLPDDVGGNTRLQIYNVTTASEYYNDDPAGTGYSDSYTDGVGISAGDSLRIRFAHLNAGTSFEYGETFTTASSSGFTVDGNNFIAADDVYGSNRVDGSLITNFTADFVEDQIEIASDTDFTAAQAYAFYCYNLTDATGIGDFWGGVTAIDTGNYRINTSVVSIYFDSPVGVTYSVKQTDTGRIFRSDDAYPVKDPTSSGYGVQLNWKNVVYVQNVGGSALTAAESAALTSIKSKTDSLTFTVAGQVDSNCESMNGHALQGDGSESDKIRTINAP